jgi:hypothetical protein
MEYRYDDIDRIVNFSTWSDKKKIDELFRIDTYMYTDLGKDSSSKDREEVIKKSRYIYRAIQKIDPVMGKELIYNLSR